MNPSTKIVHYYRPYFVHISSTCIYVHYFGQLYMILRKSNGMPTFFRISYIKIKMIKISTYHDVINQGNYCKHSYI